MATIEYFGIHIQCLSNASARLVSGILSQDLRKVDNAINMGCANVNDLFLCWTQHRNSLSISYTLTALSLAVRFSTCGIVRSLLRRGADPNVMCDMTPLGIAVQMNNRRMVALLLDSGSDVNLLTHPVVKWMSSSGDRETSKQTPLHIACRKNFVGMATYLLLKQAATDIVDGSGNTPAEVATNRGHLHILIAVDRRTSLTVHTWLDYFLVPTTKLIMASVRNNTEMARCSIVRGADVNGTDKFLNTALHNACYHGNQKLVELLLENDADAEALNCEGKSPLQVSLEYGYLQTLFVLIEHKCALPRELLFATNSRGNTLLHIACKQNRVLAAEQLIKQGAFLHVANKQGKSPIHYAWQKESLELKRTVGDYIFRYSHSDGTTRWKQIGVVGVLERERLELYAVFISVVSKKYGGCHGACSAELIHENLCSACGKLTLDGCHFLLSRGMCNVDMLQSSCYCRTHKENFFTSLLHIACTKESTAKMVEQLIEHGADVNAVDCQGNTPLHLACCRKADGCMSVISTLLEHGSSPYVVNDDNKTALGCAFFLNDSILVRWLILQKGVDIDAEVLQGFNDEENTLLMMLATGRVDDESLWRLVERGARINVPRRETFDQGRHVPYGKRQRLLEVLAKNDDWSLVRKLVEVGCCDFTNDTSFFHTLIHPPRWWIDMFSNERLLCLSWLLMAGFGQYFQFTSPAYRSTDRFVREFLWQEAVVQGKNDAQISTDSEGEETNANAETRSTAETLTWLEHNVENPRSLSCLCVYTIRQQLVCADPDGKSIFPSINQLPLPTKLKDRLKLRDIQSDGEYFNTLYQRRRIPRLFDMVDYLPRQSDIPDFLWFSAVHSFRSSLRCLLYSREATSNEESVSHANEDQSVAKTNQRTHRRRLQKRNYTRQNVTPKAKVSLSIRSSRILLQPRRRCH